MGHFMDVSLELVLGIYMLPRVLVLVDPSWQMPKTSSCSQYSVFLSFTLPLVAFSSPTSWEIQSSWLGTAPFSLLLSDATRISSQRWRLALAQ